MGIGAVVAIALCCGAGAACAWVVVLSLRGLLAPRLSNRGLCGVLGILAIATAMLAAMRVVR